MSAEVFVPVHDDDAMRGFILQAMRANTEALSAVRDQGEKRDGKLDKITDVLHSIDKRLTVIENSSLERDLTNLREDFDALVVDVRALQAIENERKGAMKFGDFLGKAWPALVGVTAVAALVAERAGLLGG